jgi:hypothetical protein
VVITGGQLESLAQMWSASVTTALAITVMALLAYRRLDGSPRTRRRLAIVCGLVLAFGTSAWSVASRSLWQHGPALLMLALGLLALDGVFPAKGYPPRGHATHRIFAAGASLAFAIAVRPTNAIALVLVGAVLLWKRRHLIVSYVAAALVVLVPWIVITRLAYGTWFQPYDSAARLGHRAPLLEAVGANLISPSRGLLVFSPICVLAVVGVVISVLRSSFGMLEAVSAAAVPSYLLAVSLYPEWWAGNTFGPRYMSETLPFLFVLSLPFVNWLAAALRQRRVGTINSSSGWLVVVAAGVMALVVWSVSANAQGGVLRASTCWNGVHGSAHNVDNDPSRVWSWGDPQFETGIRAISSRGLHAAITGACPANSP